MYTINEFFKLVWVLDLLYIALTRTFKRSDCQIKYVVCSWLLPFCLLGNQLPGKLWSSPIDWHVLIHSSEKHFWTLYFWHKNVPNILYRCWNGQTEFSTCSHKESANFKLLPPSSFIFVICWQNITPCPNNSVRNIYVRMHF